MKHTPGPWKAIEQGDANAYAVLANDKRWVIAFSQNGEIWTEEQKANARLIEAAPELLAELIKAQRFIMAFVASGHQIGQHWRDGMRAGVEAMDEVITKAGGYDKG